MGVKKVEIFDSTLRDGSQGQGISFSIKDKVKIVKILDKIGVTYIEAGNPGSNPKDMEFFNELKSIDLKNSKVVAFGSTRRAKIKASDDKNLANLLNAGTDTVVVFGKSWDFQVKDILKTTLDENLNMIGDTIKYLTSKGKEVIFDAEHYFDGYKKNPSYALKTARVAKESGARTIVLCDTNGGSLPLEIKEIVEKTVEEIGDCIGIHSHNDIGMADANSIMAVMGGASHVQGTFIGMGERCGNSNLSNVIATLKIKMGIDVISEEGLGKLNKYARNIAEISNIPINDNMPYIGSSAFAHKGGMHIDAVCKAPESYEHIRPEQVGNKRRFLVSEVSGKSTVFEEIQKLFPSIKKDSEEVTSITNKLKELEYEGYQFEGAEGTLELLMRKIIGKYRPFFKLNDFKIIGEKQEKTTEFTAVAIINLTVDGKNEVSAAEGYGPVNALDKALRKALELFYPQLKSVRLVDYKVRVLDSDASNTGAKVRVLIESTDGVENWSTVGVSNDVVHASWTALVDSIEYKLIKDIEKQAKRFF